MLQEGYDARRARTILAWLPVSAHQPLRVVSNTARTGTSSTGSPPGASGTQSMNTPPAPRAGTPASCDARPGRARSSDAVASSRPRPVCPRGQTPPAPRDTGRDRPGRRPRGAFIPRSCRVQCERRTGRRSPVPRDRPGGPAKPWTPRPARSCRSTAARGSTRWMATIGAESASAIRQTSGAKLAHRSHPSGAAGQRRRAAKAAPT